MKRTWSMAVIFALLFMMHTAGAANQSNPASQKVQEWKQRISDSNPSFADWNQATLTQIITGSGKFSTESKPKLTAAAVWRVTAGKQNLGYIVTTADGQALLEFSLTTPTWMQLPKESGTYLYAGPGMHLFQTESNEKKWVNLANGELLPDGEPIVRSAMESGMNLEISPRSSYFSFATETDSDRGVAVMIAHGLKQSVPFSFDLLPNAGQAAGYLVYTVLAQDYYSVWAITGLQTIDVYSVGFLELKDLFAKAPYPIYVRADMPVNWIGSK